MSDVSRETSGVQPELDALVLPAMPTVAAMVFGDRLALAQEFTRLLATEGVTRGLIGPREAPRLWERHVLNCAALTDAFAMGATVADIGSGAGLPGIVLALRRPDLKVTLIEPLLRRTTFLSEVVEHLGLDNVEVVRARAEEVHGTRTFDAVTSRAVAALDKLARWSLPLVRPGGDMVAMKGSSAPEELARHKESVHRLGGRSFVVERYGEDWLDQPTTVIRVSTGSKGV